MIGSIPPLGVITDPDPGDGKSEVTGIIFPERN
jgi:hypothetical protein